MKTFLAATGNPDVKIQAKLAREMVFVYQSGIGELIYALVTCRPDISYAIICCAQSSICSTKIHYHAVKHILKYLYLTKDDGIHYW